MNILLMMMGGKGTRFGADIPKQYIKIKGNPIFYYILKKYSETIDIGKMIIVVHSEWKQYVNDIITSMKLSCEWEIVNGGESRSESVKNGLICAKKVGNEKDVVLIHDATHPYVDVIGTKEIIEIVKKGICATLGEFQYDTVYQMSDDNIVKKVLPRKNVTAGASPEAFPLGVIFNIYMNSTDDELEKMTSAGAIAIENNMPMQVVETNLLNLKITYKKDMELFKYLFDYYFE